MLWYLRRFRNAHPRTKSFILNVIYMTLLMVISTIWAYYNLIENRTDIPADIHIQTKGKP